MGRSIIPINKGFDYQYLWFWYNVHRLFLPSSKVTRVGLEIPGVQTFDDVGVFYDSRMCDESGNRLLADYHQVKFHMNSKGSLTHANLTDPRFIGRRRTSLLQGLHNLWKNKAVNGAGIRCVFVSPWAIHPEDPIAGAHDQDSGRLLLERLAEGRSDSEMGQIRNHWQEHLDLASDEDLWPILKPLRIRVGPTLSTLREQLNLVLYSVGLKPVPEGTCPNPYLQLAAWLVDQDRRLLSANDIESICKREGLWLGRAPYAGDVTRVGVRSFTRWTDTLADETDYLLTLTDLFEGRHIKSPSLWDTDVVDRVSRFAAQTFSRSNPYHLLIHAHCSIAFLLGHLLPPKSSIDVIPIQANSTGGSEWSPSSESVSEGCAGWEFSEIACRNAGYELAIALSVTHPILEDVQIFVAAHLPNVGRIVHCVVGDCTSDSVVQDGAHAKFLAQGLSEQLKGHRRAEERYQRLHVFYSGPNGLMFLIGQLSHSFGPCTVYEYDFERNVPGAYSPGISFPISDHGR